MRLTGAPRGTTLAAVTCYGQNQLLVCVYYHVEDLSLGEYAGGSSGLFQGQLIAPVHLNHMVVIAHRQRPLWL